MWLHVSKSLHARGFGQLCSLCFHRKEGRGDGSYVGHAAPWILSASITSPRRRAMLPHAGPCRQRTRLGAVILLRADGLDHGRPTKRENAQESSPLCECLQLCQLRPLIYTYQSIFSLWSPRSTLQKPISFRKNVCALVPASVAMGVTGKVRGTEDAGELQSQLQGALPPDAFSPQRGLHCHLIQAWVRRPAVQP